MFRRQIKHKYGAKPCDYDNKKFRSKLEKAAYILLKEAEKKGQIAFFLRETPFELSDRTTKKHRVDFIVFFASGDVKFLETKGLDLDAGKLRRKLVETQYNIEIVVAKSQKQVVEFLNNNI